MLATVVTPIPVPDADTLPYRFDVSGTGYPEGTEFGIIHDFPPHTLARFAAAFPEAIGERSFEYRRKGFPLVEVTTRCLHWYDDLGLVRITVVDEVKTIGRCQVCFGEHAHLGDACYCGGSKRGPLYLIPGHTFMETQQTHAYWHLAKGAL